MNSNYPNPESEMTIMNDSQPNYMNGGQPNYMNGSQQPYNPSPYQPPVKKNNNSTLLGVIIGLAIALAAGIGFMMYSNHKRQEAELAFLKEQHRQDSIAQVVAKKKAEADAAKAEANAAKAEAALHEAEAIKYASASGTYSGRVAGNKYTIYITQNGNTLSGSGSWKGNSNHTELYGTIYGGTVEIEEYYNDDWCGSMQGTISGKYFTGTFTNTKGATYAFTLTR